jgi:autotransporter translocation and assembly factor TamB
MNRFFRWIRWALASFALLLVLAIAGVLIYTQTDSFRRLVQEKALTAINQKINGVISWHRLEGSVLGNLRIYDLRLQYRDRDVFRAARAELGYSLLPLLWGRVQITQLRAVNPWVELRKDGDGDWTLVEALSTGEPSTEPSKWVFNIDGIAIEDGEVIFEPESAKPDVYRVRRLNLKGGIQVANGLDARVTHIGAWLEAKGAPQVYAQGALTYRQTSDTENVALDKFWLQTTHSRVMLAGTVKQFKNLDTDLHLAVNRLAAVDLVRFVPQWPAGVDVQGNASARGTGNALETKFALALAGAEISGAVRADVLSAAKALDGNVAVRSLQVARLLPRQNLSGIVSADMKVSGEAANVDSLKAAGTVLIKSTSVNQINLGEIALQGNFTAKVLDFTGQLAGPAGAANWRSHVALGVQPEYRIELAVPSLDAARLLQFAGSPPSQLSFNGTVEGTGFDPKTMNTRANVDVLQSRVGSVAVQDGKILARISQGRIQLQQAQLQATGASLRAQGELGIEPQAPGNLDYRLEVTNLTPWLELVERKGSGRLELVGKASGNLAQLKTSGAATLREVNLPEGAVKNGRVAFALERSKDAPLPGGSINLDLAEIRAGVQLQRLQGVIQLPAQGAQAIAISATARDQDGRSHRLVAEVENQPSTLLVRARELVLTLPDGSWRLAEPATITRAKEDFFIDKLILRNQSQTLSVSGRFSPSGAQALDANVDRLSLAALKSFLATAPDITGNLSAQVQVRGTAAAPAIDAKAEISDSKIAGQSYRGMRASSRYQNQNIALDVIVEQDSTHNLEVRGKIPLALSWDRGWSAQPLAGMDLRARSDGLSLAFLNALKPAAVQNINGEISLDVALRGTLADPEPRGTFALRDGTFDAKPIGTKVTAVFAEAKADAQRVTLSRLSARAGSGTLEGSGVVALRQFAPENINLTVRAQRWPAAQTAQYRAVVNGNVRVTGAPSALQVAGAVEVVEGNIRPDLGFLNRGPVPLKRDPTIVVVQNRSQAQAPAPAGSGNGSAAPEDNGLLQKLVLNMTVTIPNNFWIRHPNANVELRGKLTVVKKPEADLAISGLLETVRGWVGFQGRRFTLTEGRIQFTGGKPTDAVLEVTGEYRVNGYLVNVVVSGTAAKPTLVLKSQPVLEQSDILALLLFGKPVADLTKSEQVSLQQNAIDLTAGFAAATLGRAVSDALGLQNLGIDLSDVSFTGGQVRFGRYVGPRTYVSVSQDISGDHEREVSLEYQLTPNWRIGTSTTIEGKSSVDVIWHKRY